MTDPIGTPKPPVGGDFSKGTYEQVLMAVTGYGPNLHGVLDTGEMPGKGWFVQGSSPAPGGKQEDGTSGGTGYSYHAWDKWYIAVNRDATCPITSRSVVWRGKCIMTPITSSSTPCAPKCSTRISRPSPWSRATA